MANMSYCRFENTYHDLRDCLAALEEGDDLSDDEKRYKTRLVKLCKKIARDYGNPADTDTPNAAQRRRG